MFGFDSKDVFFVFPSFFLFWNGKTNNTFSFKWIWSIKISKNKKNSSLFCFFSILGLVFCIETYQKSKQLEFFFVFFEVLVDSMYGNNQKTQVFFWFLAFETRKNKNNLGKTPPKKTIFWVKPTILLKVFFCFFWFPRHPQDFWLCFFFVFPRFLWSWWF